MQKSCPDKNKEGLLGSLGDEISLLTQVKQQVEEAIARSVSQGLTATFSNSQAASSSASLETVGASALSDSDSNEESKSSHIRNDSDSDRIELMSLSCDRQGHGQRQGCIKLEIFEDEEGCSQDQDQDPDLVQGSDFTAEGESEGGPKGNTPWTQMNRQGGVDLVAMASDTSTSEYEGESEANGDVGSIIGETDLSTFLPALPLSLHFTSSKRS